MIQQMGKNPFFIQKLLYFKENSLAK